MPSIYKRIFCLLFDFFIVLSIVVFLISVYSIVKENTEDVIALILSTCGVCFIIFYVVYHWTYDSFLSLFKNEEKQTGEPPDV